MSLITSNKESTLIEAGCKINLFLSIVGLREDGYHELRTVFLPLPDPRDTLNVSPLPPGKGILFTCVNRPSLDGPDNIIVKTYEAFRKEAGTAPDVEVKLEKRIPIGAGLGGGSSNAAAFLLWLNENSGSARLSEERLLALAARLGADVPFFIHNRPCVAAGIGEAITPITIDLSGCSFLLVCPDAHVSTKWAYAKWDKQWGRDGEPAWSLSRIQDNPLTKIDGEAKFSFSRKALVLANSFEAVVFQEYPRLRRIKQLLLWHGAAGAMLSGSGSTVFGLFKDPSHAIRAAGQMCVARMRVYLHHL